MWTTNTLTIRSTAKLARLKLSRPLCIGSAAVLHRFICPKSPDIKPFVVPITPFIETKSALPESKTKIRVMIPSLANKHRRVSRPKSRKSRKAKRREREFLELERKSRIGVIIAAILIAIFTTLAVYFGLNEHHH